MRTVTIKAILFFALNRPHVFHRSITLHCGKQNWP